MTNLIRLLLDIAKLGAVDSVIASGTLRLRGEPEPTSGARELGIRCQLHRL